MSETMQMFLAELCEFMLNHGHETAAGELADHMDNEENATA